MRALEFIENLPKHPPIHVADWQPKNRSIKLVMLQANFSTLFTISINAILIGYYWICPAVLLQAPPNLLLLINRSTIWILFISLQKPYVFQQRKIGIWDFNCCFLFQTNHSLFWTAPNQAPLTSPLTLSITAFLSAASAS